MDVLSEVLARVRITGSVLAEIQCAGAWGIAMGTGDGIPFHYVLEGQCWQLGCKSPMQLYTGDLVAAPHWPSHALASSPKQPLTEITELIAANGLPAWTGGTLDRPLTIRAGEGHQRVRILSGVFTLEGRGASMLLNELPDILSVNAKAGGLEPQLAMAMDFIREESVWTRPGYVAVAARLMDLLFIQILRACITLPTVKIGLLAGLSDPSLARALAAIHKNPAKAWTVAKLAAEAYQSRTTFAERFRGVVGLTPIQYVHRWRMTMAEDLLARRELTISQVRGQLGFNNGFSFARAFRAHKGQTPSEYRRSLELLPP